MPNSKLLKIAIPLTALVVGLVALAIVAGLLRAWWSTPFPVFGIGEVPEQPIDFPHTVHADELGIQCEFCHRNVSKGEAATVPAVEQCIFCHRDLPGGEFAGKGTGGEASVIQLRTAAENGDPINWQRVHRLPDHVQFAHEPHIRFFTTEQGLETQQVCSLCHGDVAAMATVKQVEDLKMSECVDCHRKYNAPTDCAVCHY